MTKYVRKPFEVDAIQFRGGDNSAKEVLEWLGTKGGGSVTHTLPVPGGVVFETAREHITVEFALYFVEIVVTPGEFIFIDYYDEPTHWDAEYFLNRFETKDDRVNRPISD